MGIQIVSSKEKPTTIYRDENDRYFTYIVGSTNESENKLFIKKKIQFKKGIEVKNKAKISINQAFLSPYKFSIEDQQTKETLTFSGDKIMIVDFDLVEDGIDEKQKIKVFTKKENNSKTKYKSENPYDKYSYGGISPF